MMAFFSRTKLLRRITNFPRKFRRWLSKRKSILRPIPTHKTRKASMKYLEARNTEAKLTIFFRKYLKTPMCLPNRNYKKWSQNFITSKLIGMESWLKAIRRGCIKESQLTKSITTTPMWISTWTQRHPYLRTLFSDQRILQEYQILRIMKCLKYLKSALTNLS